MPERSPLEQELLHKAAKYLPGGYTGNLTVRDDLNFLAQRGKGSHIFDVSGNEYVDWLMGSGPMLLGHAHPAVVEAYYKDYLDEFPGLLTAAWGFTVETATQGIRLVLSGVFDAYPEVKIILGHLGESLPFSLWRIDQALARQGNKNTSFSFRDYFCKHFWITTSGNFSNPALLCCVMEMGVDRILFSVDYPFVLNQPAVDWIPTIPLSAEDKTKILSGNADRLLRL